MKRQVWLGCVGIDRLCHHASLLSRKLQNVFVLREHARKTIRRDDVRQRLHAIAGKYTGKDDPVAILRNQGIFPAPEEIISPFAKAHFVGGDARGSHVMPLMPVPLNTPVTGMYSLPIVSSVAFSIHTQTPL